MGPSSPTLYHSFLGRSEHGFIFPAHKGPVPRRSSRRCNADGRVVHLGLPHDGDVSQVEPAGRLDVPERIPVERETIEYHGEETVVVAVRPSSRCRIVSDPLLDDCADPGILEKGEESVDSVLFLLL